MNQQYQKDLQQEMKQELKQHQQIQLQQLQDHQIIVFHPDDNMMFQTLPLILTQVKQQEIDCWILITKNMPIADNASNVLNSSNISNENNHNTSLNNSTDTSLASIADTSADSKSKVLTNSSSNKCITVPHANIDSSLIPAHNGQKKKRRACECPNCIRRSQNVMTTEELAKRRTHKCHKCTKEYNKTSHLRAHLRAHDNYRPYVCDFKTCSKSFTRSDELKRHKRIHNDDRNFPCPICKKKFLRSDHLNKHLLVHNKA